jgi:ATP-dependent exoDNAse (exonuclease V) alpha subunit
VPRPGFAWAGFFVSRCRHSFSQSSLQRNLIYTGITRGKRLLVLIGQKKALGITVRNDRPQRRYSGLLASLRSDTRTTLA